MQITDIQSQMDEFVRSNGWYKTDSQKPQTAKNLSISLALEASELLECFQWTDRGDTPSVEDELADVVLYAAQIANVMAIDLDAVIERKLASNRERKWMTAGMEE
jgi:NTP pyrophosphatase (non-canonical NTP hydrolase)